MIGWRRGKLTEEKRRVGLSRHRHGVDVEGAGAGWPCWSMQGSEVTWMEHRENKARRDHDDREQDPRRFEGASDERFDRDDQFADTATSQTPGARNSSAKRDAPSWVNWQSALYGFVLGTICLVLAPLTSFWWLVLLCGLAVPMTLAMLDRPSLPG